MMSETMAVSNIEKAKSFFLKLNKDSMSLVDDFYHPQVKFQDPVHKLEGSLAVKKYYQKLYENVDSIYFEFSDGVESDDKIALTWRMFLKSPSIQSGSEITVDGVSIIKFDAGGKAIWHRDYFDMGEFIYERVPVLKSIIKYIKNKFAQ